MTQTRKNPHGASGNRTPDLPLSRKKQGENKQHEDNNNNNNNNSNNSNNSNNYC